MEQHLISYAIIILAFAFAIYRRIRRNIGWQALIKRRLTIRMVIFIVIGLLFLLAGGRHPVSLISDIVGIVLGCGLAYYGNKFTQYEVRENRTYFLPHSYIGGAVVILFLGRLIYRLYKLYSMGLFNGNVPASSSPDQMNQIRIYSGTSWASGLLLIMFAYYVVYYYLVMRHEKHHSLESNKTPLD